MGKYVKRAFGLLQAQFANVHGLATFFNQQTLWMIMKTCLILHNMTIENERGYEENLSTNLCEGM